MSNSSLIIDLGENELHGSSRSRVFSLPISHNGSWDHDWKSVQEEDKVQTKSIPLTERLGLEDFYSAKILRILCSNVIYNQVWQAAFVELLGTATLVFLASTVAISTLETNIGGTPTLTLLILISLTLALLVLAIMPVSGGHINPVISLSVGLMGLISISRAFIYITAQCIGSVLGALALKAVLSSDIERNFSLGGCTITVVTSGPDGSVVTGLGQTQAFYLETICTFSFLFGLRFIAFNEEQAKRYGQIMVSSAIGLFIGLNVFASTTVTGVKGYSGAGMNPTKCFGPAIVRGGHLWDGHWIFWVGPIIATLVFYIYTKIIPDPNIRAEENIHDFTNILKACYEVITSKYEK